MRGPEDSVIRARSRAATVVVALVSIAALACASGSPMAWMERGDVPEEVRLPSDFRATMVHLGSWFVPDGDASGFHDVYADPAGVSRYRATGRFADGTVLVKELRAHTRGDYTTGAGVAHANVGDAGVKQWFVMVKDATNRHVARPEWGDGWGWGLFRADDPTTNVVTDYRADCLGCHVPARETDWVYVEAYPTLDGR